SPEAPVLVVDVEREELRLGGAANVAHNVRALGASPILVGVVGEDPEAERFGRELSSRGVEAGPRILRDPSPRTTQKTRIVANHQQVLRADEESKEPLDPGVEQRLWDRVRASLEGADAALISDYGKGVVSPSLLSRLIPELERRGIPSAVDPKEDHF